MFVDQIVWGNQEYSRAYWTRNFSKQAYFQDFVLIDGDNADNAQNNYHNNNQMNM